jgi:hypothetical protein
MRASSPLHKPVAAKIARRHANGRGQLAETVFTSGRFSPQTMAAPLRATLGARSDRRQG